VTKHQKLTADVNPRDHILIQKSAFSVKSCHRDNTGELHYLDARNIPSLEFPSDHAILTAVLGPRVQGAGQFEELSDFDLDQVRDKLIHALDNSTLEDVVSAELTKAPLGNRG